MTVQKVKTTLKVLLYKNTFAAVTFNLVSEKQHFYDTNLFSRHVDRTNVHRQCFSYWVKVCTGAAGRWVKCNAAKLKILRFQLQFVHIARQIQCLKQTIMKLNTVTVTMRNNFLSQDPLCFPENEDIWCHWTDIKHNYANFQVQIIL